MPLKPSERPKGTGARSPDKKKVPAENAGRAEARPLSNSTDSGPSFPRKAVNLAAAQTGYTAQGRPLFPTELLHIIEDRHDICIHCPDKKYNPDLKICTDFKCGCPINLDTNPNLNKLAMPSQRCPHQHWKSYSRKELLDAAAMSLPIIDHDQIIDGQ